MPIINRGRFTLSQVVRRQVDTDWPSANTNFDLYLKDLISSGNIFTTGITVDTITANSILNIDTSGIPENPGNLYYTNARVLDALVESNVIVNDLLVSGDLRVLGNTITLDAATLIIEDKNITLANGAASAAEADGAGITIEGAFANIIYQESGDKFVINKNLEVTGNVIFGVGAGEDFLGGEISLQSLTADTILSNTITNSDTISSDNLISNEILADTVTSNSWARLYSANIIESPNQVFFTTGRARDSFTAGNNIEITDGQISAVYNPTVLNDSKVLIASEGNLTYDMSRDIPDPRNIIVSIEGILQLPNTDYTVNNSSLVFLEQPPAGSNIEIRFFGLEAVSSSTPGLLATVNTYISDGENTIYRVNVIPPGKNYVHLVIDGVMQQTSAYDVLGSNVILSEPAAAGANIDIRIMTGIVVGNNFNTRTFTADGTSNTYTITNGYLADQILVFFNGVTQVPGVDYTIENNTVYFTEAPEANIVVQIRELGIAGSNLATSIAGVDLIVGNLIPNYNEEKSLGTPDKRFKDLYLSGNTIYIGNATISVDNAGSISLASTSAPAFALPTQGSFIFRNKLINGNFDIWQRGTSQTSDGYGSADRWKFSSVGSTHSTSRQAFALGQTDVPGEPTYFVRHAVTSSAGSSNYSQIEQRIESVRTLAGRNATLSFYAKADDTKNIAIELVQDFGTDGSPSADVTGIGKQLIALTDSWQKYTVTVAVPSISGKTAGTTNDGFLSLIFWLDAGSDFNSRASSLGQQSGTFDIAQVQIEEGSAATPFEIRPIGLEQNLCERYYQQSQSQGDYAFASVGYVQSGSVAYYSKAFRNTMRDAPTVTLTNAGANGFGGTSGLGYLSTAGFRTTRTGTGTNASGYFLDIWKADAEL